MFVCLIRCELHAHGDGSAGACPRDCPVAVPCRAASLRRYCCGVCYALLLLVYGKFGYVPTQTMHCMTDYDNGNWAPLKSFPLKRFIQVLWCAQRTVLTSCLSLQCSSALLGRAKDKGTGCHFLAGVVIGLGGSGLRSDHQWAIQSNLFKALATLLCAEAIYTYCVLQVGGDGLFQEALNGLLGVRGGGGHAGELAAAMRLGHIPAGSTDAVACSLHGTRCAVTAALHIALGDRCAALPPPQ